MSVTLQSATNVGTIKVEGVSMLVMNANTGAVSLTSEIASPGALDLITYAQAQAAAQQSLAYTDIVTLTGTSVEVSVPSWAKEITIVFKDWGSSYTLSTHQRIVQQKKVDALTYSTVKGSVYVSGAGMELSSTSGIAVSDYANSAGYGVKTNGILNISKMSDVATNYDWGYNGTTSMAPIYPHQVIVSGVTTATQALPNLVFTTSNGVETMSGTACISYRG